MHPFVIARARASAEMAAQALVGRIVVFLVLSAFGGSALAKLVV